MFPRRQFSETVQARARHDEHFRHALLIEASNALRRGELVIAKKLLRDYNNAMSKSKG